MHSNLISTSGDKTEPGPNSRSTREYSPSTPTPITESKNRRLRATSSKRSSPNSSKTPATTSNPRWLTLNPCATADTLTYQLTPHTNNIFVMLINKKPSKPSITSKSKDLANTRKCGELTKSIINLEGEHQHILQETTQMNRVISIKQSFERNASENNRSSGKESKDFKKGSMRNKKLTESKNSKGSKSSHKSFIKTKTESKLVKQLERIIDLVRKSAVEDIPGRLQDKFLELQMESQDSDKVLVSKIGILSKILVHKIMPKDKTVQSKQDSYLKKQSKEQESRREQSNKENKDSMVKKEYQNFMDFQFSTNDLMNSRPEQKEQSQCSFNSYIAQPNEGQCVGYKRLKEDVQNKLKLDLNKLRLNK